MVWFAMVYLIVHIISRCFKQKAVHISADQKSLRVWGTVLGSVYRLMSKFLIKSVSDCDVKRCFESQISKFACGLKYL